MTTSSVVQAAYREGYFGIPKALLLEKGRRTAALWGVEIEAAVAGTEVPASLVAVRIGHETNGNRLAVSSCDERGLMQWGPWHNFGQRFGVGEANVFDAAISIRGGVKMWQEWDRLIVGFCERKLGVKPVSWDRWALLWVALSNGRGGMEAFLSAMDPDRSPVLMGAVHEMMSPSGADSMFRLAAQGRFGLKAYHPNWTKVVQTVVRRTGRAVAAAEAAAELGGDMSYGSSFLLGAGVALLVLLAIQYGPQLIGG